MTLPAWGLDLIEQAAQRAACLEGSDLLRSLVSLIVERTPCRGCEILFLHRSTGLLEVVAGTGQSPGRGPGCLIPLGMGVTGKAAAEATTIWVKNVAEFPGYIEGVPGASWELAIPLVDRQQVFGVLDIESAGEWRPDPGERRILEVLAKVISPHLARTWETFREPPPLPGTPSPNGTEPQVVPSSSAGSGFGFERLLVENGIRTVYQPVVELASGRVVGYEALARGPSGSPWESPGRLFGEARRLGVAAELDRLCLRAALRSFPFAGTGDTLLFLNVDRASFQDPAWVDHLAMALAQSATSAERIVVEVTEASSADLAEVRPCLGSALPGARLAVDDFGVGFGNLRAVLDLRPDFIKLDASVIRNVGGDFARRTLVDSMAQFAARMGMTVIAEGIESPEELAVLRELRIPLGQGYLLGRPVPFPRVRGE